jgi:hypothetical protein
MKPLAANQSAQAFVQLSPPALSRQLEILVKQVEFVN